MNKKVNKNILPFDRKKAKVFTSEDIIEERLHYLFNYFSDLEDDPYILKIVDHLELVIMYYNKMYEEE